MGGGGRASKCILSFSPYLVVSFIVFLCLFTLTPPLSLTPSSLCLPSSVQCLAFSLCLAPHCLSTVCSCLHSYVQRPFLSLSQCSFPFTLSIQCLLSPSPILKTHLVLLFISLPINLMFPSSSFISLSCI